MKKKLNSIRSDFSLATLSIILLVFLCIKLLVMYVILPWAVDAGLAPINTSHRFFDQYVMIAENLINQKGYRLETDFGLTMERPPGYVLLLYILMSVFGASLISVQITNLLLTLATAVLVFLLSKRITKKDTYAYVALLVFYLHPAVMFLETRGGADIFFMFLFTSSLSFLYKALGSNLIKDFFLAGLVFGLCLLVRTSPLPLVLFLFLYLLYTRKRILLFNYAAVRTLVFSVGFLIVLSPWMIRNYQVANVLTFKETMLGMVAFQGYYATKTMNQEKDYQYRILDGMKEQSRIASEHGLVFKDPKDSLWDRFYTLDDEIKYDKILLDYTLKQYIENPLLFVKHCAVNSLRFWFQGATPKVTLVNAIITVPILMLSIFGTYVGSKRNFMIVPLWIGVFSVYIVHIPLIAHIRYYIPLMPLLAILFSIGLVELSNLYNRNPMRSTVREVCQGAQKRDVGNK